MPEHVAELQAEEIHLLRLIREMVTPTVMIDVGAHHGTTCAPFLEAGWQVYAFEPIEANRAVLQQRWGTQPRLTIRSEAVSDCCGCKQLHLAVRPDGQLHDYFHSLEEVGTNAEYQAGPVIAVTTVSLDALVARGELPQRVGLLKIDTEGHDLAVLRGTQTIDAAVIIVEFWCEGLYGGRCPSPAEEMVRLLRQRQYYYFLAIVHEENQVRRQWSTLEGLGRQAWGNLFFFRDRETAIALQQRLEANADQPTVAEEKPRWLNLLSSVLPTTREWIFYDVGAYQGDFTALLLRHYPRALAVAFEPTPHSFDYLRIRFRHEPRVQLLPLALSDRTGVATYYLTEHAYNNSLLRPGDTPVCQSIEVPIDTLDRFRERDHRPVQLIKIDAQGHDLRILQGACHILKQDRPVILVEMT
ncbi:MAG: FkbM family methyltransferase, partial [Gemmataceae bacterium]|nr:FkbM family methyltransferase [Gemmataceae bacterium]